MADGFRIREPYHMPMVYKDKWREYAKQCDRMVINPNRVAEFERAAKYAIANKAIYQRVEIATGTPWPLTACAHKRESDAQDKQGNPLFTSYVGNGQPLWIRTTIVPEDRGPFITKEKAMNDHEALLLAFIAGCKDAYQIDGLIKVVPPWPLEKYLFHLERLNGIGYHNKGMPAPYIWGGTNIQQPGKYVRDHVFDATVMDTQLGCAGMLYMIAKFDTTFRFTRET
jgi:lysozyme family protein